jgi:hypothetical protein
MKPMKPGIVLQAALDGIIVLALALGLVASAAAQAQPKKPMSDSDRKDVERLQAEVKQLDTDAAAAAARSAEGRRQVTEMIAKQFKVEPRVVEGLRNRRLGYGEVTVALALSEAMMKQDKSMPQQRALDALVARRKAGQGWGVIAHNDGVKLGRLSSEVSKAEKQISRIEATRPAAPADKAEKPKAEKSDKTKAQAQKPSAFESFTEALSKKFQHVPQPDRPRAPDESTGGS